MFATAGASQSFENTLFATANSCGWVIHVYCLMWNHFYIALKVPDGNLVEGMQRLQATFANRFNKLRVERSHLFQGRYKSPLVQVGPHLLTLVNYLHLNSLRASIVDFEGLGRYRWSSYHCYSGVSQSPFAPMR